MVIPNQLSPIIIIMSIIKHVILVAVMGVALGADTLFKLVSLSDPDALCLDGSHGAYYLSENDPTKIVISFEGGGWCGEADLARTLQACYQRSKTNLGSSKGYPATFSMTAGMLSQQPTNYFANWTKAYLKYCDGSGHQGTKSSPVPYKDAKLYFRGSNVTIAQLQSLNQRTGLFKSATHIVVTGQSAGGLATFLWTNYIADRAPKGAKVWSIPDSGIFLDSVDRTTNTLNYRQGFESLFKLSNVEIDPPCKECVAAYPNDNVNCMFAQYLHPSIKVPLFSIQSLYDSWSLYNIIGMRCVKGIELANCNEVERAYIEAYHKNTTKVLFQSTSSNLNGFWAPVCLYHVFSLGSLYDSPNYQVPARSGNTLSKSLTNWIEGITENPRHIDVGEWPDNGPCAGV